MPSPKAKPEYFLESILQFSNTIRLTNERDSLLVCHTENSSSKEYLKTSENIFIDFGVEI